MRHAVYSAMFATVAIHAPAAQAQQGGTIQLPNGTSAPYPGQGNPVVRQIRTPSQTVYYTATDLATGNTFFYTAAGNWVGTRRSLGGNFTGPVPMPPIPTTVTLPNGIVVPYFGQGVPEVFTSPTAGITVLDPVGQRQSFYNSAGQPIGGGAWFDDPGPGVTSGGGSTGGSTGGAVNVPEPESLLLFALPAALLAWRRRRKRDERRADGQ